MIDHEARQGQLLGHLRDAGAGRPILAGKVAVVSVDGNTIPAQAEVLAAADHPTHG